MTLQQRIESLWASRTDLAAVMPIEEARATVHEAIDLLDSGAARVAEVVVGMHKDLPLNVSDIALLSSLAAALHVEAVEVLTPTAPGNATAIDASLFDRDGVTLDSSRVNFEMDFFQELGKGAKEFAHDELDRQTSTTTDRLVGCCGSCLVDLCSVCR